MPRWLGLAILLVFVLAVPAWAQSAGGRVPQGFQLYPAPKPVGDIRFLDAQNRVVRLADFKGRVVLLNVWATWCPGCQLEMPALDKAQEALGAEGLTVLAVSLDKKAPVLAGAYFRDNGIRNLPLFFDPAWALRKSLGVEGLPATFLISRDGWGLGRADGWLNWSSPAMLAFLRDVLHTPN